MTYKYEVVLSFAGEQRNYVEKVAEELKSLEITCFYDFEQQVELWGKNLNQYLDKVYYQEGKYFIPFISEEYISKVWTKFEIASALERNMIDEHKDFQQYILPVKFQNIRVPGLPDSIGCIDANKFSPKELAGLIYEKIYNEKPEKNLNSTINDLVKSNNIYPQINEAEYETLKKTHSSLKETKAILISGEHGLGKTTVIERYLQKCSQKILTVKNYVGSSFAYEPLLYAISPNLSYSEESYKINFSEFIKKELYKMCSTNDIILYFRNIETYENELLEFCVEITKDLLIHFPHYRTLIIFEYDSDQNPDLVNLFYQFSPKMFEIISLKRMGIAEIKAYMQYVFGDIEINYEELHYIKDVSFGNIMYINIIINYLKNKGIIITENKDKYVCKRIKKGSLKNVLKNYILDRYNRLDENLKDVLLKSSVLGEKFNSTFLSDSFEIADADEILTEIEDISLLIKQEENESYLFENNESYKVINEKIEPRLQKEWHQILAEYFDNRLIKNQNFYDTLKIEEKIRYIYPIYYHYKEAHCFEKSLPAALELADCYEKISDFTREIELLETIKRLLSRCNLNDCERADIYFKVLKSEAKNKQSCSKYLDAILIYEKCIALLDDEEDGRIPEMEVNIAYCYYMYGDYQKALLLTQNLKEKIEGNEQYNYLYCNTLSFLASLYDLIRNVEKKNLYFTNAMTLAKEKGYKDIYYSLLKKASLVFYEELSLPMYNEAKHYFEETKQLVKTAEVLHNIATDSLYLNKPENIMENAKKSIHLFNSIGNTHAHYPYNTCGLYEMLYNKNYRKAHEYFEIGLTYKNEPFSEITLNINNAICYLKEGNINEAEEIFRATDSIIDKPINNGITVFNVYRTINQALVAYYKNQYRDCIKLLESLWDYPYLEQRHEYIAKQIQYHSYLNLHIEIEQPILSATLPILERAAEENIYFCTVRFFE